MTIDINIVEVIESTAEQLVIVEHDGVRFGAFDGYKPSSDGGDRFAAAKWMEGTETEVEISAITPEAVENVSSRAPGIYPNEESPTDFQHHTFCGVVTDVEPDVESAFEDLHLFGGTEEGDRGVKRVRSESYGSYLRLSLDEGSVLVEVPDEEFSPGDTIEISEIRTDIVGFVEEALS